MDSFGVVCDNGGLWLIYIREAIGIKEGISVIYLL